MKYLSQRRYNNYIAYNTAGGFPAQPLEEGPKFMQMGGLILRIARIADGIVQIPSPHIKPEATAPE
ncbi:hypothetical protein OIU84_024997 [Salix udensis]|uniref:Uncharacterized protein n=1 Tax=Salix udensis TaxID=889485 RepID=A0AAD6KJ23_9ROSI|nr:hypothetical protein OIU84_024997 [Salix udensis]